MGLKLPDFKKKKPFFFLPDGCFNRTNARDKEMNLPFVFRAFSFGEACHAKFVNNLKMNSDKLRRKQILWSTRKIDGK